MIVSTPTVGTPFHDIEAKIDAISIMKMIMSVNFA